MTKEEIIEMAKQAGFVDYELDDGTTNAFDKRYETFAKLVAEHEPVAWISENAGLYHGKPDKSLNPLPLYLAPPQRTWVGLTAKEKHEFRYSHMTTADFIDAIEAKLKEKNL